MSQTRAARHPVHAAPSHPMACASCGLALRNDEDTVWLSWYGTYEGERDPYCVANDCAFEVRQWECLTSIASIGRPAP